MRESVPDSWKAVVSVGERGFVLMKGVRLCFSMSYLTVGYFSVALF